VRLAAICALILAAPAGFAAAAASGELDDVMHLLAQRQHGRAEFVEQQFLKVLDHPLESSGELRYDAPDRLEKRTLEPRRETLMLRAQTLTVERSGRTRTLDLHRYPQVLPFIDSLRATLAGDRAALEKVFAVDFSGSADHWTLMLTPRDAALGASLKDVRIDGMKDQLIRVEIRQRDGDRSLMTLRTPPGA
jgi:hypothetical protein